MKSLIIGLLVAVSSFSFGQDRILIEGGTVHTGTGKVIDYGLIGIEKGEILFVKNGLTTTVNTAEWDTIINAKGQQIYPGFIAPNTTLGLTEIDAVRATRDFDDVGTFNPHVRSLIAFNAESKVASTVRTNGILLIQATPRGGVISGTSSVVHLNGWNWEDAVVSEDDGIHLNWPSTIAGGGWWAEPQPKKFNDKYGERKKQITDFFKQAKAYADDKHPKFDARFAAMRALFNEKKRCYIHANELKALTDIIEFVQEYDLNYPVIVGGYDSYLITKQLADANIPVMLPRVHSLPLNEGDDLDLPYKLPFLLQQGGVKFCLQNSGDMEAMNGRNLPFLAGTARTYGLTEEQAIAAVTSSSAEILGIDKQYGSIEKGKQAVLFISKGDALDMMTNKLSCAIVRGKFMPLTNMQSDLYEKYKKKYQNVKK